MSDQDFQERVFEYFARLEAQRREDNQRLEAQRREDNQRIEKRLDIMIAQTKEDNQRIEKRLDIMTAQIAENTKSIGALASDVGWIKGKMEAKREEGTALWSKIAVGTAICSAIIALIALFA